MRLQLLPLLATLLFIAADPDKKSAMQEEMKRLAGAWTVLKAAKDGKDVPVKDRGQPNTIFIRDGKLITYGKDGTDKVALPFRLDPNRKPKTIDIIPESPKKGTIRGIYVLQRNKLTICLGEPGAKRPTEFTAKAGSGLGLFTLERKKP
jgi:uncharacterized protein (TIGR03067 family)